MTEFWLQVLGHPGFGPNLLALGTGLGDTLLARILGPFESWGQSLDATTARLFGLEFQKRLVRGRDRGSDIGA